MGYDEKFALRFFLRSSISSEDDVLVIEPAGFREDEKAARAFGNLSSILEGHLGRPPQVHEVDYAGSPAKEIARILKRVTELSRGHSVIRASLSGGMRILVVLTTLALTKLALGGTRVNLEVDFENLSGHAEIPLSGVVLPRNERLSAVLRTIHEMDKPSVRKVASRLGISHTSAHREIRRLISLGLLTEDLTLTEHGQAYLELVCF